MRLARERKNVLSQGLRPVPAWFRIDTAAILPIDSEHSAIFQCLQASPDAAFGQSVERILLTASGGPFRTDTEGSSRGRHAGTGAEASDLEHGRARDDQLRDAYEQSA